MLFRSTALAVAAVARFIGWPVVSLAVAANVAAALAWPLYATAFNARVYTLARQSPCPLRFHIVAEGGWDMGTFLSCLAAAALLHAGFGYHLPLAVGVLACGLAIGPSPVPSPPRAKAPFPRAGKGATSGA